MNRAIGDCGGEVLVISQFTLYGDCRKGNRPSFTDAAPAETADRLNNLGLFFLPKRDVRDGIGRRLNLLNPAKSSQGLA
jgi:D-tyrosyl-tRNA(Tyr) deacylase